MTREEAIEAIKFGHCDDMYYRKEYEEAVDMAIKALEQQPCEDVVSRNAITRALNEMDRYIADELTLCDTNKKFPHNEVFIVDDVYEQIVEQLPPVTPYPKTGHWKRVELGMFDSVSIRWECSECKKSDRFRSNFCFNCGARMESEG